MTSSDAGILTPDMLRVLAGLRAGFGYGCAGYRNPHLHPSRNEVALDQLQAAQLISTDGYRWTITARGNCLLDHILALPLPVQPNTWSMPT
jgi:hypothetical protein